VSERTDVRFNETVDWQDGFRIAAVLSDILGDDFEDLMATLVSAADGEKDDAATMKFGLGLVRFLLAHIGREPGRVAEILAILTDKDADWFLAPGNVSLEDMGGLLREAVKRVPFGSLLSAFTGMFGAASGDDSGPPSTKPV